MGQQWGGGLVSGRPSNLLARYFGKVVGDVSLTGLAPGWQVGGVGIDNPSGSWLLVEPLNVYVPPYTLGWATPIIPANATVEVTYTSGPAGLLISTLAGGPATVTLYGYPIAPSPGVPVIANQQPVTSIESNLTTANVVNVILVAAVPNRRIRVYFLEFGYATLFYEPVMAQVYFRDPALILPDDRISRLQINGFQLTDRVTLPAQRDSPLGFELNVFTNNSHNDGVAVLTHIEAVYSII